MSIWLWEEICPGGASGKGMEASRVISGGKTLEGSERWWEDKESQ